MGKTRSELREIAMVILYQIDILKNNNVEFTVENLIAENLEVDNEFVRNIVYGVVTHVESLYEDETPNVVAINEAIELAKKYSDDNVRKIINAVLDKVNNDL